MERKEFIMQLLLAAYNLLLFIAIIITFAHFIIPEKWHLMEISILVERMLFVLCYDLCLRKFLPKLWKR